MIGLKLLNIICVAEKVTYGVLMCIGFYFIGNVWEKFCQKKSNFAVYREPITEMPTISTWLKTSEHLKFGENYNIVHCSPVFACYQGGSIEKWASTTSNLGSNNVSNGWKRKYESEWWVRMNEQQRLIITPSPNHNTTGTFLDFALTYKFEKSVVNESTITIGLTLSTENNTYSGGRKLAYYHDGSVAHIYTKPGEENEIMVYPEKYLIKSEKEDCRDKPYSELLYNMIAENMKEKKCSLCSPRHWVWNNGTKVIVKIPICRTKREKDCFNKYKNQARRAIERNPCTLLQYNIEKSTFETGYIHEARVKIKFPDPPRVQVKER